MHILYGVCLCGCLYIEDYAQLALRKSQLSSKNQMLLTTVVSLEVNVFQILHLLDQLLTVRYFL